jgi:hypothetical protein
MYLKESDEIDQWAECHLRKMNWLATDKPTLQGRHPETDMQIACELFASL